MYTVQITFHNFQISNYYMVHSSHLVPNNATIAEKIDFRVEVLHEKAIFLLSWKNIWKSGLISFVHITIHFLNHFSRRNLSGHAIFQYFNPLFNVYVFTNLL